MKKKLLILFMLFIVLLPVFNVQSATVPTDKDYDLRPQNYSFEYISGDHPTGWTVSPGGSRSGTALHDSYSWKTKDSTTEPYFLNQTLSDDQLSFLLYSRYVHFSFYARRASSNVGWAQAHFYYTVFQGWGGIDFYSGSSNEFLANVQLNSNEAQRKVVIIPVSRLHSSANGLELKLESFESAQIGDIHFYALQTDANEVVVSDALGNVYVCNRTFPIKYAIYNGNYVTGDVFSVDDYYLKVSDGQVILILSKPSTSFRDDILLLVYAHVEKGKTGHIEAILSADNRTQSLGDVTLSNVFKEVVALKIPQESLDAIQRTFNITIRVTDTIYIDAISLAQAQKAILEDELRPISNSYISSYVVSPGHQNLDSGIRLLPRDLIIWNFAKENLVKNEKRPGFLVIELSYWRDYQYFGDIYNSLSVPPPSPTVTFSLDGERVTLEESDKWYHVDVSGSLGSYDREDYISAKVSIEIEAGVSAYVDCAKMYSVYRKIGSSQYGVFSISAEVYYVDNDNGDGNNEVFASINIAINSTNNEKYVASYASLTTKELANIADMHMYKQYGLYQTNLETSAQSITADNDDTAEFHYSLTSTQLRNLAWLCSTIGLISSTSPLSYTGYVLATALLIGSYLHKKTTNLDTIFNDADRSIGATWLFPDDDMNLYGRKPIYELYVTDMSGAYRARIEAPTNKDGTFQIRGVVSWGKVEVYRRFIWPPAWVYVYDYTYLASQTITLDINLPASE
ncbi:MAG: hypothetical protein ACTSVW_02050 [Candidatus Njordarchaeales archaeon]